MEMFYIWLIIAITLGVLEASTTSLVSIWFVISSLVAMIVSKFTSNIIVQVAVFILLGVLLIPFSKKLSEKIKNTNTNTKTNIDRIIGMTGVVTEDITKDDIGEVKVDGKKWSAYSDTNLHKGDKVTILSIDSVKLKVEKRKEW